MNFDGGLWGASRLTGNTGHAVGTGGEAVFIDFLSGNDFSGYLRNLLLLAWKNILLYLSRILKIGCQIFMLHFHVPPQIF